MPGWYGMENGEKPEMEEKGNRNGKRPQAGQGRKMAKKGAKNGFWGSFHYFSILGPFRFPFFAPVQLGAVFHFDSIFFHFRLFAVFHAMPARHDPNAGKPTKNHERTAPQAAAAALSRWLSRHSRRFMGSATCSSQLSGLVSWNVVNVMLYLCGEVSLPLKRRQWYDYPKDPAVLKILRASELSRRSVFTMPPIFTALWTPLWGKSACKTQEKRCQRRVGRHSKSVCGVIYYAYKFTTG